MDFCSFLLRVLWDVFETLFCPNVDIEDMDDDDHPYLFFALALAVAFAIDSAAKWWSEKSTQKGGTSIHLSNGTLPAGLIPSSSEARLLAAHRQLEAELAKEKSERLAQAQELDKTKKDLAQFQAYAKHLEQNAKPNGWHQDGERLSSALQSEVERKNRLIRDYAVSLEKAKQEARSARACHRNCLLAAPKPAQIEESEPSLPAPRALAMVGTLTKKLETANSSWLKHFDDYEAGFVEQHDAKSSECDELYNRLSSTFPQVDALMEARPFLEFAQELEEQAVRYCETTLAERMTFMTEAHEARMASALAQQREALQAEKEIALRDLRSALTEDHERIVEEVKAKVTEDAAAAKGQAMMGMSTAHAKTLDQIKSDYEREHNRILVQVKEEAYYERKQALDNLEAQWKQGHRESLEALKEHCDRQMAEVVKDKDAITQELHNYRQEVAQNFDKGEWIVDDGLPSYETMRVEELEIETKALQSQNKHLEEQVEDLKIRLDEQKFETAVQSAKHGKWKQRFRIESFDKECVEQEKEHVEVFQKILIDVIKQFSQAVPDPPDEVAVLMKGLNLE
ncbi:hypothetical protein NUU61_002737 [Penicillium alfredii]|uniref:Uncharacterized protein n=1 Tax=Penicillium alfredii TaxID=1506179 RepID=A0A9W9KGA8_9EURO|nr:uncharacterized protein NUU61_002737 [Penicillium alfredii]KAJ5105390.1 hypothetical protein NUU61_002737 [Penicillium alfredii]